MPELPEVQTTVNGINTRVLGMRIEDVWTSYVSRYYFGKNSIKDPKYFEYFHKNTVGATIKKAERRAKNILIHLDNSHTIVIHMKMTGHIMHGEYTFDARLGWSPKDKKGPLADPFNRFIRLCFTLDNGKHLVMSDMRRFASVSLYPSHEVGELFKKTGPEPLHDDFTFNNFLDAVSRKKGKVIKIVLLDQEVIAGVGNIYADESLWRAGIDPRSKVEKVPREKMKLLYLAVREVLKSGIDFGGDSMSDYRNIDGERGKFQEKHNAYKKKGHKCNKRGCKGVIERIVVGTRGTHFCPVHQERFV